jgi:hypothetical protein
MDRSMMKKRETRNGILRAGLVALVEHMTTHELSAPLSIDLPSDVDEAPSIRVRLGGIGQQHVWLNTVEVVTETNEEPASRAEGYVRTTWVVSLPETCTRVELIGLRPRAMALVAGTGVAS